MTKSQKYVRSHDPPISLPSKDGLVISIIVKKDPEWALAFFHGQILDSRGNT